MNKNNAKKLILFSIIATLLAGGILAAVLWPRKPDARALLAKADCLSEQNLCLLAILEEEPGDEECWRRLLTHYQVLGADPFTLEASKQAAEAAIGHALTLPEESESAPEEPGKVLGPGGILQEGIRLTDYEGANALATDGETVYLATQEGIDAVYHGLRIRLTAARASRMMAAENGLYFLNATARRVQFIARDGHKTETLSPIAAADFAFLEDSLFILGADGAVYRDGTVLETLFAPAELCTAGGSLYAGGREGLMEIGGERLLSSPVFGMAGGEDGRIYYIDQNGYPACYNPATREAVILREKTAIAIGWSEGKAWYMNENRKIKRIS